jgi:hypothetical protein
MSLEALLASAAASNEPTQSVRPNASTEMTDCGTPKSLKVTAIWALLSVQ